MGKKVAIVGPCEYQRQVVHQLVNQVGSAAIQGDFSADTVPDLNLKEADAVLVACPNIYYEIGKRQQKWLRQLQKTGKQVMVVVNPGEEVPRKLKEFNWCYAHTLQLRLRLL